MLEGIMTRVREACPLVHCITNFVTVNDCANIILAAGGTPTMAQNVWEAAEIAAMSQAVVLNMGVVGPDTEAMLAAGRQANRLGRPVVLDPVAVGASRLRREVWRRLESDVRFAVIRGNISEIKTLATGSGSTRGVDADTVDEVREQTLAQAVEMAKGLAARTGAVIAVSGALDIVAGADRAFVVRNGHPIMTRITGSGCMLTALIGAFCGANPERPLEAAAAAVCAMGLCGELAYQKTAEQGAGTMTFRTHLIDFMSLLDEETLLRGMKVEIR